MIVVINYGLGNLRSIQHKINHLGYDSVISSSKSDILEASGLILPGVGSFASAMDKLRESDLLEPIEKCVLEEDTPVFGICLGMQLFARYSEEGNSPGLGWIDAKVRKFDFTGETNRLRVPHVGWNTVEIVSENPIFTSVDANSRYYFTHSFYMDCAEVSDVAGFTQYGMKFPSIVVKNNILGTQFHPEKSHRYGLQLLNSFLKGTEC